MSEYIGEEYAEEKLDGTDEAQETTSEQEAADRKALALVDQREVKESKKSVNYTHNFDKPTDIGNTKYKAITFYFDRLTGNDIEAVEEELQQQNKFIISPEVSSTFQVTLAARAAGVASDNLKRLPVADYMKIKNKARDFLVQAGY
jgi:hypothetical protein